MHLTNEVLVISGLMVLGILFLMTMFARLYRKAGPHQALVVYGVRGTRIIKGRGTVILPMVETYRELSLQLMSFDVAPQQDLYTVQGVAVTVEAVAQIKVKSDPESIVTASEQFLTKSDLEREGLIRLVMEGHLRGIIGQLSVEQLVKEPEFVGDRVRATCADDMTKMGLEVISFTIKEIRDKNEYITNMGRPDIAAVLLANGARLDLFCAAMMGKADVVRACIAGLLDCSGGRSAKLRTVLFDQLESIRLDSRQVCPTGNESNFLSRSR
jgi:flotillin